MATFRTVTDVVIGVVLIGWAFWFFSAGLFGVTPPTRGMELSALGWACFTTARWKLDGVLKDV